MLPFGTEAVLGPEPDSALRLRNFHPPEDGFAWTAGRWGEVEFDLAPSSGTDTPAGAELVLDLGVLRCPRGLVEQDLFVYLNGWRAASARVAGRRAVRFRARGWLLEAEGNVLTLQVGEAACPSDYGLDDRRPLGVQLFSLRVEAAAARHAAAPGPSAVPPRGRGGRGEAPQAPGARDDAEW